MNEKSKKVDLLVSLISLTICLYSNHQKLQSEKKFRIKKVS